MPHAHQSLNMFKSCFTKLILLKYLFTPRARVAKHVCVLYPAIQHIYQEIDNYNLLAPEGLMSGIPSC